MKRAKEYIVYTYIDKPWAEDEGDKIRIMHIVRMLREAGKVRLVVLSRHSYPAPVGIETIIIPRIFYRMLNTILRRRYDYDLSPTVKATNYLDELYAAAILLSRATWHDATVYVLGSMSLMPFFLRLLGWEGRIVYDPLSNYAQTLYISKRGFSGLLKLGIYLFLHKLSLWASDMLVYPTSIDAVNAKRMFGLKGKRVRVIQNPLPFCYKSIEEYMMLRKKARSRCEDCVYFILLAGSKSRANEEAVDLTIRVFRSLKGKYMVHVTGPWLDKKRLLKSSDDRIIFHGRVPLQKLRELVAAGDYGLAPVFTHAAGSFLKTITYFVGGLGVITSPQGLIGIGKSILRRSPSIMLVHDVGEFKEAVIHALRRGPLRKTTPIICGELRETQRLEVMGIE